MGERIATYRSPSKDVAAGVPTRAFKRGQYNDTTALSPSWAEHWQEQAKRAARAIWGRV